MTTEIKYGRRLNPRFFDFCTLLVVARFLFLSITDNWKTKKIEPRMKNREFNCIMFFYLIGKFIRKTNHSLQKSGTRPSGKMAVPGLLFYEPLI